MYTHNIDPVLLSLGPIEIRYYSLAYIFGAIITYYIMRHLIRLKGLSFKKNQLLDLVVYALLGAVIGGRLGYVLFYNLFYYIKSPMEILAVWHGGMSFHGGLLGAALLAYYYCRKNNMEFWKIADLMVIPITLALFLGRIGNFINGELYGRITNVPWAFKFKGVQGFRHPSQLYEAFKNLLMFSVLWNMKNKKKFDGYLFSLFVIMYGILRFIIEFFREPDAHIGLILGLSLGQYLCLAMVLIGIVLMIRLKK